MSEQPLQAETRAFQEALDRLLAEHSGEFAVFHDGDMLGVFPT